MLVRFGKLFLLFALITTTGAHWATLQTLAWTTMLADNLQSVPLREALVRTLDGRHPCCLCKAIASGKQSEKKSAFSLQSQKLEFPPVEEKFILFAPSRLKPAPLANASADSLGQKPPTPPPRGLFI